MKVWRMVMLSLLLSLPVAAPTTAVSIALPPPTFAEMTRAATNCAPLPAPPAGDTIVPVSTEAGLWDAVNTAQPHTTILLADGTYNLGANGHYVWIDTPYVTLRSASGNREAVILDDNYSGTEIVTIAASNVTVADITIKRAYTHPIHVSAETADTLDALIYNVHIIDPGQQAIKVNPAGAGYYPDNGVIACSTIELTDAGRPYIRDDCYTGGIDMHQARDWVVRDNLIEGFWCASGLSEHGIHFWRGCRDPIVERNVLRNNARGIGFGMATSGTARTYTDNPCPAASGYIDHYGGIIRNNFISANRAELFASADGYDNGISLWNACEVKTYHNSVISTQAPFSSIEWRYPNTSVHLVNNLVSHNLRARDGATATQAGNLTNAPLTLFVDGSGGDLHLLPSAAAAIDQGAALSAGLCDDDIDGDPRPIGSARDIGADEYGIPAPAAVHDLRVSQATLAGNDLTVTLRWTPPVGALTTTVRYAAQPITAASWDVGRCAGFRHGRRARYGHVHQCLQQWDVLFRRQNAQRGRLVGAFQSGLLAGLCCLFAVGVAAVGGRGIPAVILG
ncbi:MAG: hypothetical protein ACP5J4_01145 [Anaerolineae bacterium]